MCVWHMRNQVARSALENCERMARQLLERTWAAIVDPSAGLSSSAYLKWLVEMTQINQSAVWQDERGKNIPQYAHGCGESDAFSNGNGLSFCAVNSQPAIRISEPQANASFARLNPLMLMSDQINNKSAASPPTPFGILIRYAADGTRHYPGVWKTTVVQFDTDMVTHSTIYVFLSWKQIEAFFSLRHSLDQWKKCTKQGIWNSKKYERN